MTKPPPRDRFKCPTPGCQKWVGQHLATGLLARHNAPGERYELCAGSLHPVRGLPSSAGRPPGCRFTYTQPTLF
jgi:hypothetical protein